MRSCSLRRRATVLAIAAALIVPSAAYAWYQTYVSQTNFNPDGIGLSAFNSGLHYNSMQWQRYEWDPYTEAGQVTLCNSSYQCYDYTTDTDGFVDDSRSISYGRGKCHAAALNPNPIYVDACWVSNE